MDSLAPSAPPVFRAYGDADDPLRLIVLLASNLGARVPGGMEAASVCLDPKARPRARIEGLRTLLLAEQDSPAVATLIDPDALASGRRGLG